MNDPVTLCSLAFPETVCNRCDKQVPVAVFECVEQYDSCIKVGGQMKFCADCLRDAIRVAEGSGCDVAGDGAAVAGADKEATPIYCDWCGMVTNYRFADGSETTKGHLCRKMP